MFLAGRKPLLHQDAMRDVNQILQGRDTVSRDADVVKFVISVTILLVTVVVGIAHIGTAQDIGEKNLKSHAFHLV